MEESAKTKERTFYIRVSNLSVENGKSLFVGPYKTSEEAESAINQAMYNGQELMEGDEFINDKTLNVSIVGGTNAKREGMKESLDEMPQVEKWESYFPNGDIYKSNRGRPKKGEEQETIEETLRTAKVQPRSRTIISPISKSTAKKETPLGVVIVSSDPNIISWLVTEKGYAGAEVISYVSHPNQIENKRVIGVVPTWLICHAAMQGIVNIPGVKRGDASLSPQEITRRGGKIDWYSPPKFSYSE